MFDVENLDESYKKVKTDENIILVSTDVFKELIPFLKLTIPSKKYNYTMTYYPVFKYKKLFKLFSHQMIQDLFDFSKFKIYLLEKIAELVAPYLHQYLIEIIINKK